ncbi:MAG TPA: hypothetical protein VK075_01280 [Pseudogracilibacillus sp.]|nr:hypothetical protein [Pseudogracilibacillus sp.]
MAVERITLMEFYLLESLSQAKLSDAEIIDGLAHKAYDQWKEIAPHFDYAQLYDLYEADQEAFQRILNGQYQIKFLTFPGLQRLLEMKFDKIADFDFDVKENGIFRLQLRSDEEEKLRQIISSNWHVEADVDGSLSVTLKAV